ncbi:phosphorylase family protein [Thiohalomonas denitrificans]|uniref:phosphorylase family protein n=1 Tax=Thiohalomonas denitrificans TaxID=415747 RepID=UPI0015869DCE|nr:hypothetical protein [Thiohalomonas denitrificans]
MLVDDEYTKAQEISEVLRNSGVDGLIIRHETTAQAARQCLRASTFDFLIIDLHLPDALGAMPSADGGLSFFDLIKMDENVPLPEDVLFITGREELVMEANAEVLERGAVLCQYRSDSSEWKKVLIGRIRYGTERIARKKGFEIEADVAIVTAMRDPELAAVLELPFGWESKRMRGEPTTFHVGSLVREDREITIVAASAHRKGMPSAAALASKMSACFRPRYMIMLGICAGIQGKTNLGDVVIADPAWDWGSGKRGQDENGSAVFRAAPYQLALNSSVSQIAADLGESSEVKRSIRAGWDDAVPEGIFDVHVGPMASGASVIADDISARSVVTQHKELLAIEMEAYAVMASAEYSTDPKPVAIAIKSVCDYADSNKNDLWQRYASYTSAAFAQQLLVSPFLAF